MAGHPDAQHGLELLGEVLGLSADKIRVRTPDVGGGFGNKADFYGEEVVASILSRRTGRPVKLIEDHAESFGATAHSREQKIEAEIAAAVAELSVDPPDSIHPPPRGLFRGLN